MSDRAFVMKKMALGLRVVEIVAHLAMSEGIPPDRTTALALIALGRLMKTHGGLDKCSTDDIDREMTMALQEEQMEKMLDG